MLILCKTLLKKPQKATVPILPTSPNVIQKTCLDSKSSRFTPTTTTQTAVVTAVSIELRLIPAITEIRTLSTIGVTITASAAARVMRKSHIQPNTGQIVLC